MQKFGPLRQYGKQNQDTFHRSKMHQLLSCHCLEIIFVGNIEYNLGSRVWDTNQEDQSIKDTSLKDLV